MVLRNELLAGCGAAVRKLMSEGCPPSTLGCETPLITVKSLRCACSSLRYGEAWYSRPVPVGKNRSGRTPRLLQMPNIRRGVASAAGGEEDEARAVLARACKLQDPLELLAVGEAYGRARSVDHQLLGEVSGDGHFVAHDEALEFLYIAESAAIGHLAGGVDGKTVVKGECLAVQPEAGLGLHVLGDGPVAFAMRPHHVETLQCKA